MRYVERDVRTITGNQEIERFFLFQDAVHIRNAKLEDACGIMEIANAEFGSDYFDEKKLKKQILSSNSIFRIAETSQNEIVGFSYAYKTTTEEIKKDIGIASLPPEIEELSRIVFRKSMAVKSSHQRKGIASLMLKDALSLYEKQDFQAALSFAWKSKKGINVKGLMNSFGFMQYQEIPNFWTRDSIEKKYFCPECGNPCRCSAVIFFKMLSILS